MKRKEWVDIAKGITILLMILGHNVIGTKLGSLINTFHMPIFFILSGYLYREKELSVVVKNTGKKVLIPYVVTVFFLTLGRVIRNLYQPEVYSYQPWFEVIKNTLLGGVCGFGCGPQESYIHFPYMEVWTVGALWFLPTYFWATVLFAFIQKKTTSCKMERSIVIIMLASIGYIIPQFWIWLPTNFDIALFCLIYIYMGYLVSGRELSKMKWYTYLMVIFVFIVAGVYYHSTALNIRSIPSVITVSSAIAGSLLMVYLAKWIEDKLKVASRMMAWLGRNTLIILCVHLLCLELMPYELIIEKLGLISYYRVTRLVIDVTIAIVGTWLIGITKKKMLK